MRNKGGIVALLVAFLAISIYFLARTWKANDIRKDAEAYGTDKSGKVDYTKKSTLLGFTLETTCFLRNDYYRRPNETRIGLRA